MVKSGGFIVGVASALDLPEATISGAFRVLRESGLMTSGARGVNAPEMTDLDAARMLIAMLVNERPAYAESGARDFGQLVCTRFHPADGTVMHAEDLEKFKRLTAEFTLSGRGLPDRHSFEQAVAELVRMHGDDRNETYWKNSTIYANGGHYDPTTTITIIPGDMFARISMQGNVYEYFDPLVDIEEWEVEEPLDAQVYLDAEEAHNLKKSRYSTAIVSERSVDQVQITALARLIRSASD